MGKWDAEKMRLYTRLYMRKKREERYKLGLCVTCGSPAMEGRVTCRACTIRSVEGHRRRALASSPPRVIDDLPGEIWKPITGYEDMYEVSNLGRVKSLARNNGMGTKMRTVLLSADEAKKYLYVTLSKNKKTHHHRIHRLVALAFIPNTLNLPLVNHKDSNTLNNSVSNLEWVTSSQNNLHAISASRMGGEKHWKAKLDRQQVVKIRQSYPRISCIELAKIYNLHVSTIRRVVKHKNWKYV